MPKARPKQLATDGATTGDYLRFNGTLWLPAELAIVDDPTPQLAGTLDCQDNHIDNVLTATFNDEHANGSLGATPTINWNNGNDQTGTLSANITGITLTAPGGPGKFTLRIVQDAATPRTVTGWPATVKWMGGTVYVATATTSAVDILTFLWNGTTYWVAFGLDFS